MTAPAAAREAADTRQDQFLDVLSREAALARFEGALFPRALPAVELPLLAALGLPLAADIKAPVDAPPFDRSNVDGFAVRSADLAGVGPGSPVELRLNGESVHCGAAPTLAVAPGTATAVATGAPMPRGADAMLMVEHTHPAGPGAIEATRSAAPGQFVSFAGSDIARGETLLRAGAVVGAREIGMLAACGVASVSVVRKPRVAVLSTGDELTQPGEPLRPAAIFDTNGPIVAAAVAENGGEPHFLGAVPDDEDKLWAAMSAAFADCDMLILSGGTSKGAGDLTHRLVGRLGAPGIVAHGVALKPGKPLCLAVCDGKPVVILPGFPTSAMFTFHDMIAPVLRRMAGLPPRAEASVEAVTPVRIPSELGRREYVMVSLVQGREGLVAYPSGKGSGAITSFAQADGFLAIDALADHLPAGARASVTLFTPHVRAPDLVVIGSHCLGLDAALAPLARAGLATRVIALGSMGGVSALRRGECDLAPLHLLDDKTGALERAVPERGHGTRARLAADAGGRVSPRRRAVRGSRCARRRSPARWLDPACLDGQPQSGGGHAHPHGPAAGRRPARGLLQPAALAQRGGGGGGAGQGGLGAGHPAGGGGLWAGLHSAHAGALRLRVADGAPRQAGGAARSSTSLASEETRGALRRLGFEPA
jgi:molybdenum cofactor synthesis domain-containing protein